MRYYTGFAMVVLPHISKGTKIILLVEFIVLAYMLYVLSASLYKSYQVDRFIAEAEKENTRLENENSELIEDYQYYKSPSYKEKIAKQNFGLVRPGEEVIVLTPEPKKLTTEQDRMQAATEQYYNAMSNPRKWFLFFFDRERY